MKYSLYITESQNNLFCVSNYFKNVHKFIIKQSHETICTHHHTAHECCLSWLYIVNIELYQRLNVSEKYIYIYIVDLYVHWSVPKDDLLKIQMYEAKVHMTPYISDTFDICGNFIVSSFIILQFSLLFFHDIWRILLVYKSCYLAIMCIFVNI